MALFRTPRAPSRSKELFRAPRAHLRPSAQKSSFAHIRALFIGGARRYLPLALIFQLLLNSEEINVDGDGGIEAEEIFQFISPSLIFKAKEKSELNPIHNFLLASLATV